jgi:hypothetical protein
MTTLQLKARLIELIQHESDPGLLEFLGRLLDRRSTESNYRSMLLHGVEQSEEDIAAGRVHTLGEAKRVAKGKLRNK